MQKKDIVNIEIDGLLQSRKNAVLEYTNSTKRLIGMGVKFGQASTGEIEVPESFTPYLGKYEISEMEFEWEVVYTDGSVLRQFEGEDTHSFKDIDLSRIKSVAYISNFNWPSDNRDSRVTVRLNCETGKFEFNNGFIDQESLAYINDIPGGERKLVLFSRKRKDFSAVNGDKDTPLEFLQMIDETVFYNRFVLGYETPAGKRILIISPNGKINLFEK